MIHGPGKGRVTKEREKNQKQKPIKPKQTKKIAPIKMNGQYQGRWLVPRTCETDTTTVHPTMCNLHAHLASGAFDPLGSEEVE